MMKRRFLIFLMVTFGLFAGVNTVWAQEEPEVNPMTDYYWARMIAQPSTGTGGTGKVYMTTNGGGLRPYSYENPVWRSDTSRAEGYSQIYVEISISGVDVVFQPCALPDEGSYFAGWSYSNGGTDLGWTTYEIEHYMLAQHVLPSKKYGFSNIREYNIYATFLPLLIESYTISGSKTTESRTCTQEVTFRVAGALADVNDFEVPTIIKQTGTGTWTVEPNTEELWHANKPSSSEYVYSETYGNPNDENPEYYAEIRVPVTFEADDDNAGEFSATLQLRSKAGKTMNVVLSARTTGGDHQAIRYSKTNEWEAQGDLSAMISGASEDDIVKLNNDYDGSVSINKNITFNLNGYTLSNALTVSGGNVTLAYSPFGGSISNDVTVAAGSKLVLNGGGISGNIINNGTLELNGAAITGNVTNNGTMTTSDGSVIGKLESSGALTVNGGTYTNNSGIAIEVSGGNAQIKKGSISGSTYGILSAGTTSIEKLAAISGGTNALKRTAGTLTVNNGKFVEASKFAEGEIEFKSAYFQGDATSVATAYSKQLWRNTAGTEFREGYKYFVGNQEAAQASNVSVCRIGQAAYASLEEALAFAANHTGEEVLIFMENDYTLKAGYYTVPANATVVVPKSNDQDIAYPIVEHISVAAEESYPTPYPFRTLTLENGVNLNVLGTIELTCPQYCKSGAREQAMPGGPFGHMVLKPGSHITLSSGSELRAWGYVTGDGTRAADGTYLSGEIDARRGSIVREQFQMGDWKGGDMSFTMIYDQWPQNTTRLFPVYTYFIQNVESPVKYHPGSSLVCATSVDVSYVNAYANEIKVVGVEGEAAMFLMNEMADAENTWVRKWYDANKDQQVYEVNSGAKLGSLVIDLGEVPEMFFGNGGLGKYPIVLDSRKYVLPLTNNFKIHLLSGNMQFTQSTSCLPGMEVEVDKKAEISIIPNEDPTVTSGALYFYDADQWSFMNNQMFGYVGLAGDANKFGRIVHYSATLNAKPDVRDISSPETIGDAKLIVHGTFRSASGCSVYTTWSKGSEKEEPGNNPFEIYEAGTGGASIISTNEDAGTFIFDDASPIFDGVHWREDGTPGVLEDLTGFGNSVLVNFDNNNYGRSDYPIAIPTVLKTRTYQSKLGEYQNYQQYCQYYLDDPSTFSDYQQYCEKATQMEGNGSLDINTYSSRMYGWELCTPARLKNGDGTFAITEGTPAGGSYCYMNDRWTRLDVAEENECFMKDNYGTFYAKPAEYVAVAASVVNEEVVGNDDHTYSDAAGAGRLFIVMDDCQWWEVEKKDNLYHCIHPNNDTYYYWDETAGKWMEQRFTITWKNWDGEEIKSYTYNPVTGEPDEVEYSVTYGTQAEFLGSNPTRNADEDYTYSFTGWSPALDKVTSDVTYTATYEKQQRMYTIIFTEEGGAEIERQFLIHNAMPACENTPTRTGFTLEWEPAIAAVTGDATYRATWLENPPTEYQVTFYDYNGTTVLQQGNVAVGSVPTPPANPSGKPEIDEYTYVFDHWSPALEAVSATSAKTYTAVYREVAKTYTIRFYQEDGFTQIGETQSLTYGAMPVAPDYTKEETGYTITVLWKNKEDVSKTIETVKEDADYIADVTTLRVPNKYTVTLRSNPSEACTFAGAGLYDYGSSIAISQTPKPNYTFTKWTDEDGNEVNTLPTTVNGDITLIANFTFEGTGYTITWNNWDGKQLAYGSQKENTATTYVGATPTREATNAVSYTFYGWTASSNSTTYKNGLTPKATADETYTAYFNVTDRTYTITWASETGTAIEVDYDQPYGTAIAYNSATPTKPATEQYTYTFDGWSTSVGGDVVELPETVEGDATFYAHFISTPIVSGYNLVIGVNGKETLAAATTKDNLIITSNGVSSGQLINANNLTLNGEAIFRMEKTFNAGEWYAVAVPWTVDPSTGIYAGGYPLSSGSDIYVIEFDANAYASADRDEDRNDYWHFLDQNGHDMQPGKLYMIWFKNAQTAVEFHKKAGVSLLTTSTSVALSTSGSADQSNWNAIANPALYHANLNTGAADGDILKYNGNDAYVVASSTNMVVGQPIFAQVSAASTVVATPVGGGSSAPYRRVLQETAADNRFVVELTHDGDLADRIIVQTADQKANEYVIGKDIAKMSVSTKVAQMWMERYNAKLCKNTVELNGEYVNYPLSISAPVAGEYVLTTEQQRGDMVLYLTQNGITIANLSDGDYTLYLNGGTTNEYGLRVGARTPQSTTGMDEAIIDAQGEIKKVLIGNQVFIIRGNKVYTIDGQLVK